MEIRVLLIKPGENPSVVEVEDRLKSHQELVDGYIKMVHLTQDVALLCNEEGKIREMKPNRHFNLPFFKDIVCGNIVIVGINNETGEFDSLTAEQVAHFTDVFKDKFCVSEV